MIKSMFSLEFPAAGGFQKQTHTSVWLQRLKEKKMYVYMGQIYLFLKVNYLCLTTQVLPLQKKAFEKQAVSATCSHDSRQNDSCS